MSLSEVSEVVRVLQVSACGTALRFSIIDGCVVVSAAAAPAQWPLVVDAVLKAGFASMSVPSELHGIVAGSFELPVAVVPEGFELHFVLAAVLDGFSRRCSI